MVCGQLNPWCGFSENPGSDLERILVIFPYHLSPFLLEVELVAETGHGGVKPLCALLLDCASGSTGGLLVALAGDEEWGGIASFL